MTPTSVPAIVPISRHFGRSWRTWPLPPAEKTDAMEPAEKTDPTDPAEPIENADANDPMLPMDSTEPVEPIDSTDPLLNKESAESRECTDRDIVHLPMDDVRSSRTSTVPRRGLRLVLLLLSRARSPTRVPPEVAGSNPVAPAEVLACKSPVSRVDPPSGTSG